MALAATFTANFDSFNQQLAAAETRLQDFEVPVGNVDRALRRMTAEFSGTTVIREAEKMAAAVEAVGGASALTATEQAKVNAVVTEAIAKYDALGQEAPKDLTDLAAATRNLDKDWAAFGSRLTTVGDGMTSVGSKLSVGITAPLVAAGVASTSFSMDFNAAMANVASLIPGNVEHVEAMKRSIQDLAIQTGRSTTDLAGGLYQVISAFGDTSESVRILDVNARAAAAGVSTTKEAIDLTSAVTKAYGDTTAVAVERAADMALMTVRLGQTTFPELASSIGKVAPLTAQLAVSQEELNATFATLTGVTGSAAEVSTQFRAALIGLQKPSEDMKDALNRIGFESGEAALQSLGFKGTLDALLGATGGNTSEMVKLWGQTEAWAGIAALAGTQSASFNQKLLAMKDSAGTTTEAFNEQTQGVNKTGFAWEQMKRHMEVVSQHVGDALAPSLRALLDAARPLLDWVVEAVTWFGELPAPVQTAGLAVAALAAAIGPFLVAAGTLISSFGTIAATVGPLLPAFGGVGAALTAVVTVLTGPVGIVVAVGAAIAAFVSWMGWWDDIADVIGTAWSALKDFVGATNDLPKVAGDAAQRMADADIYGEARNKADLAAVASRGLALAFGETGNAATDTTAKFGPFETSITRGSGAIRTLTDEQKAAAEAAKKHAAEVAKLAGADLLEGAATMADAIKQSGLAAVLAAQGVDKVHEAMTKAINVAIAQGKEVPQAWLDTYLATLEAEKGLNAYVTGIPKIGQEMAALDPAKFFKDLAAAANAELPKVLDGIPAFLSEMGTQFDQGAARLGPTFANALQAGFGGSAANFGRGLSETIVGAVMGGGNPGDAIGAYVGQGIGTSISTWATGALSNVSGAMGGLLSGAANAVLPGVGSLIGAGFSAIMDGVFGGQERRVNDMRDTFVESAGGIDALNVSAVAAGLTLDNLLSAKKTKDFDKAVADLKAGIEAHKRELESWGQTLNGVLSQGILLTEDLAEQTVRLYMQDPGSTTETLYAFLNAELANVAQGFNTAVTASELSATSIGRFGSIAIGVFQQLQEGGISASEALQAIAPGLTAIQEAADELGLNTGSAFQELVRFTQLSEQFAPLVSQVSGLGQMMTGLHNTGMLSSSLFYDIAGQAAEAFGAMVEGGASGQDAMRLLQPQLQQIWQIQHDLGFEVDDATQALIDQGVEAGVVGSAFQSSGDKMTDAVNRLVSRLNDLVNVMTGTLPASAETASDGITANLNTAANNGVDQLQRIADQASWVMNSSLPSSAVAGRNALTANMGQAAEGGVGQLQRIADQGYWVMNSSLPSSARNGATAINTALNGIDASIIQSEVHDMEWEFREGIPRAATDGTYEVGREMVRAAGFVGDVNDEAASVVDQVGNELPSSALDAAWAIDDLRRSGVTDLNAIEDAVRAILFGRSPGGFKDFKPMTRQATAAIAEMSRESLPQLRALETAVSRVSTRRLVALPGGGSTLLGAGGAAAATPQPVRLVLTDARARVLAEVIAEQLPYLA